MVIFLFSILNALQAQEMTIEGTFSGQNLYFRNPSLSANEYCIKKVLVNNKPGRVEVHSEAFEVDFSLLGIEPGEKVSVKIFYGNNCKPELINPDAFKPSSDFKFIYIEGNKNNRLIWKIAGKPGSGPFEIEQYRWRRWIKSGELDVTETEKPGEYELEITPTSGMNKFRVKMTDDKGIEVYSNETKFRSSKKEVNIVEHKVKDKIDFTDYTIFEILDKNGNYITDGEGRSADVSKLKKGEYWINYDNKADIFYKK